MLKTISLIMTMLLFLSCVRHQNTQFPISEIDEVTVKYRIGKIESKHSRDLEEFIRTNYKVLLQKMKRHPF